MAFLIYTDLVGLSRISQGSGKRRHQGHTRLFPVQADGVLVTPWSTVGKKNKEQYKDLVLKHQLVIMCPFA